LIDVDLGLLLYYGGPFASHAISFIHNYPEVPDSLHLGNELFFDGNYEFLLNMLENKKINLRKIRFYSGCVVWDAGELENEIREHKWWTSELTAQQFFSASTEELWTNELLNNGHIYGLLNEFPDPCLS